MLGTLVEVDTFQEIKIMSIKYMNAYSTVYKINANLPARWLNNFGQAS